MSTFTRIAHASSLRLHLASGATSLVADVVTLSARALVLLLSVTAGAEPPTPARSSVPSVAPSLRPKIVVFSVASDRGVVLLRGDLALAEGSPATVSYRGPDGASGSLTARVKADDTEALVLDVSWSESAVATGAGMTFSAAVALRGRTPAQLVFASPAGERRISFELARSSSTLPAAS